MSPSNLPLPFCQCFQQPCPCNTQFWVLAVCPAGSHPTLAFVLAVISVNALSWEPCSLWEGLHTNSGLCWHLMAVLRARLYSRGARSFLCLQHLQGSRAVGLWKAVGLHGLKSPLQPELFWDAELIFVWFEEQGRLSCSLQPCSCVLNTGWEILI